MNKFMEKAIEKQDEAYNLKYAEKQFVWSCHLCATKGILHQDCITCPINVAHCRAVSEIRSGMRKEIKKENERTKKAHKIYSDRYGHVTLVMRDIQNAKVNVHISINRKEVK